eukprot:TRINITY_DN8193_c0_g1_i1.p1 TRINITY_DN8193_c0_g1~~TRINITY_DN8193_c0_g1_i1.p1  ORF type:complete len:667 (+),score=143.57 TRINITY_DN8193_c0_g1_i1:194-2194(+)
MQLQLPLRLSFALNRQITSLNGCISSRGSFGTYGRGMRSLSDRLDFEVPNPRHRVRISAKVVTDSDVGKKACRGEGTTRQRGAKGAAKLAAKKAYGLRLETALKAELELEVEEEQERLKNWSSERLEREGYAIFDLQAKVDGSLYRDRIVRFIGGGTDGILPSTNQFSHGAMVAISRRSPLDEEDTMVEGVVLERARRFLRVAIGSEDLASMDPHGRWRLDLWGNSVAYERSMQAVGSFCSISCGRGGTGVMKLAGRPGVKGPIRGETPRASPPKAAGKVKLKKEVKLRLASQLAWHGADTGAASVGEGEGVVGEGLMAVWSVLMKAEEARRRVDVALSLEPEQSEWGDGEGYERGRGAERDVLRRRKRRGGSEEVEVTLSREDENWGRGRDWRETEGDDTEGAWHVWSESEGEFSEEDEHRKRSASGAFSRSPHSRGSDQGDDEKRRNKVYNSNATPTLQQSTLRDVSEEERKAAKEGLAYAAKAPPWGATEKRGAFVGGVRAWLQRLPHGSMNASQVAAIEAAMGRRLTLWQGPPGTGKTRTLLRFIVGVRTLGPGKVLATADSNVAVDNLLEGLLDLGLRVVRIGQPAKVKDALRQATLEAQLLAHPLMARAAELKEEAVLERQEARAMNNRGRRMIAAKGAARTWMDAKAAEAAAVDDILSK